MHGRPVLMTMLAMACVAAACADGRAGQNATPAPVDDTAPSVSQAGDAGNSGLPRFVAGTYELALDRDEPLFDDSLAVRALVDARLPADSASEPDFERLRCEEWRSGGRVILEANGRITTQDDYRKYCGGTQPVFTRSVSTNVDTLGACDWSAPMPGTVTHLTCRWAKRPPNYSYAFAGDTLVLGTDCDGRDTYVLRALEPSGQSAVKRSSDVSRLEEC